MDTSYIYSNIFNLIFDIERKYLLIPFKIRILLKYVLLLVN